MTVIGLWFAVHVDICPGLNIVQNIFNTCYSMQISGADGLNHISNR